MSEWIKHDGGHIPCGIWDIVEVMTRGFHKDARYGGNFQWESSGGPYDIIEYRIVEAPREPVKETRYGLLSAVVGSWSPTPSKDHSNDAIVIAMDFVDGRAIADTIRIF